MISSQINLKLNQIRSRSEIIVTTKQKIIRLSAIILLGLFLGLLAKYADEHIAILGEIGSGIAIWVVFGSIIAIYSRSAVAAAVNVFIFYLSMLISYYVYTYVLFGFFPARYVAFWIILTVFSIFGSYALWYAHANRWVSAAIASLPITFLLAIGYPFFYTYELFYAFTLFSALLLILLIPPTIIQKLKTLLFVFAECILSIFIARLYFNFT